MFDNRRRNLPGYISVAKGAALNLKVYVETPNFLPFQHTMLNVFSSWMQSQWTKEKKVAC